MRPVSPGRVALGVALAAPCLAACNHLGGTLTSTATPLGTWTFEPTRCTAGADHLVLSSRADPLRYVGIERAPHDTIPAAGGGAVPSILAAQTPPLRLTVLVLSAGDGAPLVIPTARCRVLSLTATPSFSTRVNRGQWVTSYAGTADIDCPYPDDAHRFVGHFDFTCPGDTAAAVQVVE